MGKRMIEKKKKREKWWERSGMEGDGGEVNIRKEGKSEDFDFRKGKKIMNEK